MISLVCELAFGLKRKNKSLYRKLVRGPQFCSPAWAGTKLGKRKINKQFSFRGTENKCHEF